MASTTYPFEPKSALTLKPGQFWGIPLSTGGFACARVIQGAATYKGASRVIFYGGLLDWFGREPPTENSIGGAACIAQGKIHVKSLKSFGTPILGIRPLDLDGIAPAIVVSGLGDPSVGDLVMNGHEVLRKAKSSDRDLPSQSVWGYGFILALAEAKVARPVNS